MVNKYVKKPVTIEALKWSGVSILDVIRFLTNGRGRRTDNAGDNYYFDHSRVNGGLIIRTLEGDMTANIGDFIIKGISGEFYPCKPDIFNKTYDQVKEKRK